MANTDNILQPLEASTTGDNLSKAFDEVSAAGLQNINIDVDADATIAANSTAKSTADASNVTGDSVSVADVNYNSGLQATSDNFINVASDAGLSGIATTTGSASASTSNGTATAFANLDDAAGIQELSRLTVGGELTGLGKSLNTLSATSESVDGDSNAASELSGQIEGFQGAQMGISSDASLQGLAQFSNIASASTSAGAADAEASANQLQGADLTGLKVGGEANVVGQATLSNLSSAEAVTGAAEAESKMGTLGAQGLVASGDLVNDGAGINLAVAGIDVASDAGLTGLASITNNATAKTSNGSVDADAIGTTIQGADLNSVQIGGVGTIGGQATYSAKASAENVNGGYSAALADLDKVDGLVQAGTELDIKSDATIQGLASITNNALASSTGATGDGSTAVAEASTLIGANLGLNTDIGGIGSITGQVNLGSNASGENVTGDALASASLAEQLSAGDFSDGLAQGLVTGTDASSAFGTDIKSDAALKGLSNINLKATAATTNGEADADAFAGTIEGARLGDLNIGGIGSIQGQANFSLTAEGSNVNGGAASADAISINSTGLVGSSSQQTVNPATVSAYDPTDGFYATSGAAGVNVGDLINVNNQLVAVKEVWQQGVDGKTANGFYTADVDTGVVLKPSAGTAVANMNAAAESNFGLDVASDATLSGLDIGSLKANALSTDGNAVATSGATTAIGADLPSLNVGGIGNLTGAAQIDAASTAQSVTGLAQATAGQAQSVTGLTSAGESADTWSDSSPAFAGSISDPASLSARVFDADLNINVASDAMLTAKGFSNLDATASSTAGNAIADAGNSDSSVTGIAAGMDISVGGISNLTALAQGTADASAESVTGKADAFASQAATGIKELEIQSSSDGILKSTASVLGGADAVTTGNNVDETAWAAMDFDATGIQGLAMNAGGIGDLNAMGSVTGSADATSVSGPADARADIDAMGLQDAWFSSASDGTITGIGKVVADLGATSTASTATAEGDFDATGIQNLEAGIGGVSILKGQAQVTASVSSESVSGNADAFSGKDTGVAAPTGAFDVDFTDSVDSSIIGLIGIELNGASNGTILGTASGAFDTSAESVIGNANAQASQFMRGISTLNLDLGGDGGINAIVNDTNFVSAHSVSGNATAVASVNAIGLDGGNIHVAGNATIMANVGVTSSAESETVG